jgi:leader peptidase (prepilin peptidase)/N-methyltransferase
MIWYQHFVVGGGSAAYETTMVVGYSLLAAALVAAIFTDLAHYIIPDQINAFMLATGIGMNIALLVMNHPAAMQWGMPSSIAGALVGIGVIWGIAFLGRLAFGKDAMGHGDIKMARGIGAVILPAAALMSFALAVIMGALMGVVIIIARRYASDEAEEVDEDAENIEEPETIGSLLKCGLGYVLCIDVIGLFVPKLYEAWFEENPYAVEEIEDDPEVSLSMIPFGPYLAAGALGAMLFNEPLQKLIDAYLNSVGPS